MTISMDDTESNWEKDFSNLKDTIMQDGVIDNKTKKLLALASAVIFSWVAFEFTLFSDFSKPFLFSFLQIIIRHCNQ